MFSDSHHDLAVVGTPCQPYSRQRVKRSQVGSVESHKSHHTTFSDLLQWMESLQPKALIAEQVVGFDQPESVEVRTTPFQRLQRGDTSEDGRVGIVKD